MPRISRYITVQTGVHGYAMAWPTEPSTELKLTVSLDMSAEKLQVMQFHNVSADILAATHGVLKFRRTPVEKHYNTGIIW